MRPALVVCLLAAPCGPLASAAGPPSLSTTATLEWAIGTSGEAQKLELEVVPTVEVPLPARFELTGIGRFRADAYDRLAPGGPQQAEVASMSRVWELGDRVELELRELFVEGPIGDTWLRLGKQQVVWGQADGLKVLDVVDPQDFREFILPDFDDSRIPLWTANAEIPLGPTSLQLLWIPDTSAHEIPRTDALFAFTAPQLVGPPAPPGVPVRVRAPDRPSAGFGNSDAGARLSGHFRGWDLTANYLWHWEDAPILRRSVAIEAGAPYVTVEPDYARAQVVGGTASNAFGNLTVRGELAFTTPRWLPSEDETDRDGVVRTHTLDAVLGFDWYGFDETLVSVQLFPSWLTRDADGLLRDRLEANVTLLVRREFRHDALVAEAIWIQNVNRGDGLLRPKLKLEVRDELWVWVGVDWFYGTRQGVFGEFDRRDRAVVGVEWGI